ncbi:MAG: hypothetical protein A2Y40_04870 [Candidatus Margulisbacteria bacterium GWF2_35_9]|nr:MAG: hypothetical protein A2Y40_04870 [Candidatus Margulisbacteria bacterium GWF2_35_9]
MNKKIVAENAGKVAISAVKVDVAPGKLSDGKETVRLFVNIVINGVKIRAAVIPPKGTSDGFHEALDSKDLATALTNTQILWDKTLEFLTNNPEALLKPEMVCENVDALGGWRQFGAQAALAVREMAFKISAQYQGISLEEAKHQAYKRSHGLNQMAFAIPQSVMLSAAKHGNGIINGDMDVKARPWDESVNKVVKGLPWQEWMVQFTFAQSPEELISAGQQFHDILYWQLEELGDPVQKLSKEGGMTVNNTKTPFEIIDLYKTAVKELGRRLGKDLELGRDVHLAIDGACTENYFPENFVYDSSSKDVIESILGKKLEVVTNEYGNSVIKLNREQQYNYTEDVRANKGYVLDFYTEGTYHIVLSEKEIEGFEKFLAGTKAAGLTEIKDADVNAAGYRKFALSSLQQIMLAKHLKDSTGNVFSSMEDIAAEDDWYGWKDASQILSDVQLVGDDSWVTNPARMVRSYRMGVFNIVPLIKENQVADPYKAILMIALSEQVQYLHKLGQDDFILETVNKDYDINTTQGIKALIDDLHVKVAEIWVPNKPVIAAVPSHRSKSSFSPDVDLTLALATGSTGKIGAIGSPALISQWSNPNINPVEPALSTRTEKYRHAQAAVSNPNNPTVFNAKSVPGTY